MNKKIKKTKYKNIHTSIHINIIKMHVLTYRLTFYNIKDHFKDVLSALICLLNYVYPYEHMYV